MLIYGYEILVIAQNVVVPLYEHPGYEDVGSDGRDYDFYEEFYGSL